MESQFFKTPPSEEGISDSTICSVRKGKSRDNLMTKSQYNSLTPEEQWEYTVARIHANDEQLRIERSRAEGEIEGKKAQAWESAAILHSKKMPLDFIAEVTGLSLSELKSRFHE